MGGNFTASRVKFGHYDAIKGICLLGDSSGQFKYLDASESGFDDFWRSLDIKKLTPSLMVMNTMYLLGIMIVPNL